MISAILLSSAFCCGLAIAESETVWLRDASPNLRNMEKETSLPSYLEFELKRAGRNGIKLQLQENKRLNENAPVYEIEHKDGKQILVKKPSRPLADVKFYLDKNNKGAFHVSCIPDGDVSCKRLVTGHVEIEEKAYEIKPAPTISPAGFPENIISHLLVRPDKNVADLSDLTSIYRERNSEIPDLPSKLQRYLDNMDFPVREPTYATTADIPELRPMYKVNVDIPDNIKTDETKTERESLMNRLQAVLSGKIQRTEEEAFAIDRNKTPADVVYAVEIVVVIDPALWEKYYKVTNATLGLSKTETTEHYLRRRLAQIINGVSLRYEMIAKSYMDIYVTLSGFIFYKVQDSTNPLQPSATIEIIDGVETVDSDIYIEGLPDWVAKLTGLQGHDDHVMVFTGYELKGSVAGVAFLNGACNGNRVSVQEDSDFYSTSSVAAHELGHNLGAYHDGDENTCSSEDSYIMAPVVASFDETTNLYTLNPWRFSTCSIKEFLDYFNSMGPNNCLLDHGDYFDKNEYESYVALLPGQMHTPEQQCKLVLGDNSELCSDLTDPLICRLMLCKGANNNCYYYAAASGTPCDQPSANKWCIEGLCVNKSKQGTTRTTHKPTKRVTTKTTPKPTTRPKTTTTKIVATTNSADCVDIGWEDWSCESVSRYLQTQKVKPQQLCLDQSWEENCCAFCKGF